MSAVVVEAADAAAVRAVRHAVLRPHQDVSAVAFAGDAVPGARHVVAREHPGGAVLGVGTIAPEPYPAGGDAGDWRVRGMATVPAARGRGLGAAILDALVAHAAASGGRRVWCNARSPAVGFYERAGWAVDGEEFVIEPIGPHVRMSRVLLLS